VQFFHPRAHAAQAEMSGARLHHLAGTEAHAIVGDLQRDTVCFVFQTDRDLLGLGVTKGVGGRFLRDAEKVVIDGSAQRTRVALDQNLDRDFAGVDEGGEIALRVAEFAALEQR
jgi:hypothetical protein